MNRIRATLIENGTVKPSERGSRTEAIRARAREAGPVCRALGILEAAGKRQGPNNESTRGARSAVIHPRVGEWSTRAYVGV